ncbi:unnamed protein product [Closterium sp. Naga37s-1]|nr:unnamed protein product [Closterium sp. Naga37s-1]
MAPRHLRSLSRRLYLTFLLLSVFSAASSAAEVFGEPPANAPVPSPDDEIIPDIPGIDYSVNITLPVVSCTSGDPVGPPICFRQGLSPHPVPIPCGEKPSRTAAPQRSSHTASQATPLASVRVASSGGNSSRPLAGSTPNLTPATELFDTCIGQGPASVTLNPRWRDKWKGWHVPLPRISDSEPTVAEQVARLGHLPLLVSRSPLPQKPHFPSSPLPPSVIPHLSSNPPLLC